MDLVSNECGEGGGTLTRTVAFCPKSRNEIVQNLYRK
jgi:hypothetical protein